MAIADRIKEAVDYMNLGNPVSALIQVCIAVDATAKKELKDKRVGDRITKFLRNNQEFILLIGLGKARGGASDHIFQFKISEGKYEYKKLEEVLYELVRCTLLHEGDLSSKVVIVPQLELGFSKDRQFKLSVGLIWGMILAVVASPANSDQQLPNHYLIPIKGQNKALNELWGKKEELLQLIRSK